MRLNRRQQISLELLLLLGFFSVSAILPACNTQSATANNSSSPSTSPTATPGATPVMTPVATPMATATPGPTPTPTPSPTPNTVDTFTVSSSYPAPVYSVNHVAANWNTPCSMDVNPSATNPKDIICTTEVANLDGYDEPLTFSYTAPANGCAYILSSLNWFYQFQPGTGPANISYTVDSTSNTITAYSPSGAGGIKVVANSSGGQSVACAYDYSAVSVNGVAGPNCCSGAYTATVTTVSSSGSNTTSTSSTWPGKPGNCVTGPATYATPAVGRDFNNYPLTTIEYAYTGFTHAYTIVPPIKRFNSTNVSSVNYISTPGAPPPALVGTQIYHEFDCVDPAYALLGRIRIMVRKWNLESQLLLGAAGNPLTTGTSDGVTAPVQSFFGWDEIIANPGQYPSSYLGYGL